MDACKRGVAGFALQALATLLILLSATLVSAVQPTAAQIQQFNAMSDSQKKALAAQFGINVDSLGGSSASSTQQTSTQSSEIVTPLDRQSDRDRSQERLEELWAEIEALQAMNSEQDEEEGLKPFGYDLFAGKPSTFTPVMGIPIPGDYRVGPGDSVRIQLFGKENRDYELQVDRSGHLQLPELGPMSVAGLTFNELREQIQRTVRERYIGVESAVTLGELRSMQVFVLGEARTPGSYTVSSLATISHALYVSGGVLESGSLRNIQLKRNGKTVARLDLYDLLLQGDTSNDQALQPGDAVFIPPLGATVGVDGEVLRPAIYELKQEKSLAQVLNLAGGLAPTAKLSAVQVTRVKPGIQRQIIDLDLGQPGQTNFGVLAGDRIKVASVNDLSEGFVRLEGALAKPGDYAWRPGLRISDVVRSLRRDLMPEADLNYALIVREINKKRDIATLAVNLAEAVSQPGSTADLNLEELDRLLVFSRSRNQSEAHVSGVIGEQAELFNQADTALGNKSRQVNTGMSHEGYEKEESRLLTRYELLASVIEQLRQQARPGEPQQVIEVAGQVRFPGEYPLPLNQGLENILAAAGGLMDSAYTLNAEVSRVLPGEGGQVETRIFDLPLQVESSEAISFRFRGRDHLFIKPIPDYALRMVVKIEGEVLFPGEYTLARGESLSQLIQRAGGLTAAAFPEGAVFRRQKLAEIERERLQDAEVRLNRELAALRVTETSSQAAAARQEDVRQLETVLEEVRDAKPLGRLVINLPALLAGDSAQDVVLQDGDSLAIPQFNQAVSVIGEVQFPSSHLFQDGLDVQDYLQLSGGANQQADDERVYVVRADGSVWVPEDNAWFATSREQIAPGDTVVVPLDIDRLDKLELFTSVSQIFYQIALGAAAVGSL